MVDYNKGILLFKITKGMAPSYFDEYFKYKTNEKYCLRSQSNHFHLLPSYRNELYKRSFKYSGASLWNSLPLNLKQSEYVFEFND